MPIRQCEQLLGPFHDAPNYIYETPSHMVRRMHRISVALFTNAMSRACLDLTPVQYAVLATLRDRPGIDRAAAAAEIAYDRATLGKVVERLDQRGLIDRTV